MSEGLRCCEATKRVLLKNLYEKSHDFVYVERCASCGAHWLHRWHEMINFDGGDDSMTDWYTRITDEECRTLLSAEDPVDYGFLGLGKRPALCIDERGTREVLGQPEHSWT